MSTNQPLAGQAALVTGGGSGIGLACARALAVDGAAVTICGRTEERLVAGAAELEVAAPEATVRWVVADISDEAQIEAAVATAADPCGGLHLVVASAGSGGIGPLASTELDEWNRMIETNLTGTFLTLKHASSVMAAGDGGAIVAISSIAGVATHRFMGPYCVSKAGVDMLVRNLADELGTAGVRVNSVRPGIVETELVEVLMGADETLEDYLDQMPVRRVGQVDDVAAAVRFLLGPESSWITGVTLSVDGGHHLRRGPNIDQLAKVFFGDDIVDRPF